MIPKIYISGKYRSSVDPDGIFGNIIVAREAAKMVWHLGGYAFCPHLNTFFFDNVNIEDTTWLAGDLAFLEMCDAIYMLPGWQGSQGATTEHAHAQTCGLVILYTLEQLKEYIEMMLQGYTKGEWAEMMQK